MAPPRIDLGGHRALDLLNSILHGPPGPDELADGDHLLRWLASAGELPIPASRIRRESTRRQRDQVATDARALREWWRSYVLAHAGRPLAAEAVSDLGPLNAVLATGATVAHLARVDENGPLRLRLRQRRQWRGPGDLLLPLADAIADLLVHHDLAQVRVCHRSECTVVFLDHTKAHSRRWCTMAVCGNRAKVAAHRARRRSASA